MQLLRAFQGALVLLTVLAQLSISQAQQTLRLSAALSIEPSDSKEKTHEQMVSLLTFAKEQKLEQNILRFLENMIQQTQKVLDTAKVIEEQKLTVVPKDFTPPKYRVKAMPKLQPKKTTVKKIAAKDLREKLRKGQDINFDVPLLVTNATALFEAGTWDEVRRHWTASRIMADEYLEKELQLEYWPQDKAKARLVGNMLQFEEPERIPFSRYLVNCFLGTPAKPKLPGQNTEHCEQTVDAGRLVHNVSELDALAIFREIKNALPTMGEFREQLLAAAGDELKTIIGKRVDQWKQTNGRLSYRYFVFGPSGSGDKLHAENGLPFFDVLIHGNKRWLLLGDKEMERVAEKAREALEFDKTSAYMFFEEKLPELREEFGLQKYVEANQNPGDLIIVPSGWYRVSLALADSISYYETILSGKETLVAMIQNQVWRPEYQQYRLAYCYEPEDLDQLPGIEKGSQVYNWLKGAIQKVQLDEVLNGILTVLLSCGSALVLEKPMPELKVTALTACTPAAWKKCRARLQAKLKEKGDKAASLSLAWLPQKAPSSLEDLKPPEPPKAPKSSDEL